MRRVEFCHGELRSVATIMNLGDRLKNLRAAFPDCAILAYADLSTAMVLSASTREKVTQERLDALCNQAIEQFGISPVRAMLGPGNPARRIYQSNKSGFTVFIRSEQVPEDVLCFEFIGVPPENLETEASALLDDMASET